ncbi:hypothetical protein [Burkholderia ubonensis]|uniref:hypothetical protein n=1 Tax=Burkholderia ubonensis TaxID=101571 RepID=UPI00105537B9|nr:hypothetical protein [Burkholderia ubonensis]
MKWEIREGRQFGYAVLRIAHRRDAPVWRGGAGSGLIVGRQKKEVGRELSRLHVRFEFFGVWAIEIPQQSAELWR